MWDGTVCSFEMNPRLVIILIIITVDLNVTQLWKKTAEELYLMISFFFLQKADGTCNTNFKKTKYKEQVMKALEDFVDGNTQILVS